MERKRNYKNPIFISCIILILIIITSIIIFLNKTPTAYIQNFNTINSSLSNSDKERINDGLFTVLKNSDYFKNLDINDIYIRPESYKEEDLGDTTSISFIVDIDSLKVTYEINLLTSKNTDDYFEDVIVNCPKYNISKYPETICHGMNGSTDDIALNLPYKGVIDTHPFSVDLRYSFYDDPALEIKILDYCPNFELIEKVENNVYDWIKNDLHLNPDEYIFYTTSDSC